MLQPALIDSLFLYGLSLIIFYRLCIWIAVKEVPLIHFIGQTDEVEFLLYRRIVYTIDVATIVFASAHLWRSLVEISFKIAGRAVPISHVVELV